MTTHECGKAETAMVCVNGDCRPVDWSTDWWIFVLPFVIAGVVFAIVIAVLVAVPLLVLHNQRKQDEELRRRQAQQAAWQQQAWAGGHVATPGAPGVPGAVGMPPAPVAQDGPYGMSVGVPGTPVMQPMPQQPVGVPVCDPVGATEPASATARAAQPAPASDASYGVSMSSREPGQQPYDQEEPAGTRNA